MASLNSIYLKAETLETLAKTVKAKGEKGIELTISIQDETNNYGQNLSAFVAQSKEDREAKKKRFYVGNGKCFWTDGTIKTADKQPQEQADVQQPIGEEDEDILPF